jgi:hypothetical protein
LLIPRRTVSYAANDISSIMLNLVSLKKSMSSCVALSLFRRYPKTDADVRPPISVAAEPVIAVSKIVLSVN